MEAQLCSCASSRRRRSRKRATLEAAAADVRDERPFRLLTNWHSSRSLTRSLARQLCGGSTGCEPTPGERATARRDLNTSGSHASLCCWPRTCAATTAACCCVRVPLQTAAAERKPAAGNLTLGADLASQQSGDGAEASRHSLATASSLCGSGAGESSATAAAAALHCNWRANNTRLAWQRRRSLAFRRRWRRDARRSRRRQPAAVGVSGACVLRRRRQRANSQLSGPKQLARKRRRRRQERQQQQQQRRTRQRQHKQRRQVGDASRPASRRSRSRLAAARKNSFYFNSELLHRLASDAAAT